MSTATSTELKVIENKKLAILTPHQQQQGQHPSTLPHPQTHYIGKYPFKEIRSFNVDDEEYEDTIAKYQDKHGWSYEKEYDVPGRKVVTFSRIVYSKPCCTIM
jgi:hypothetical protein